jgi:hypothetical protein
MKPMFSKQRNAPDQIDLDSLLRATACISNQNRRIRDGLNSILAEAGDDNPRKKSIRSSLVYARSNAQNILHFLNEAMEVLDGGAQ